MEINYIQEFLVLLETGNFVKAAGILGITQSTLSRHIQALEAEFGEQLISRNSRSFQITTAGNAFAIYAEKIMEAQKALISDVASYKAREDTFLNISIVFGAENYGIYELVEAFHREEPDIRLNIRYEAGSVLNHNLNVGINDVVFTWDLGNLAPNQGAVPYTEDFLVLHIPYEHPLYGIKSVGLRDLHDEKIYMRCAQYSRMLSIIKQKCRDDGFELNLFPQPGYWMSASDRVLYLAMSRQSRRIRHNGMFCTAKIEPTLSLNLEVRYKKNQLAPSARKFLDFIARNRSRAVMPAVFHE